MNQAPNRRRKGRTSMNKQGHVVFWFMTLGALVVALLRIEQMRAGEDDAKAEKAIKAMGGRLERDRNAKGKPIIEVVLNGDKVTDAGMKELSGLKKLKVLFLGSTKVTDAGLEGACRTRWFARPASIRCQRNRRGTEGNRRLQELDRLESLRD